VTHGRFALAVLALALILAPSATAPVPPTAPGPLRAIERPVAEPAASSAPSSDVSAVAARPLSDRLLIDAIGVDARIEPVGVDPAGNMAAPSSPANVGWYRFGPRPGGPGDAVLDGHLDSTGGPAVFWDLHRLAPGDEIVVAPIAGAPVRFRVTSLRTFSAATRPPAGLFALGGPPRLTLITCAGAWDVKRGTYSQRLVVDAVLD
jgi:hypothetical protein